ncbi:hypothetical protein C1645_787616, partial [Glomus cerebriforme]
MSDVSIPINQTENFRTQNSLTKYKILKNPKQLITLIVMLIICLCGAALVLILFDWIKLGSEKKKAFWIEIFSQILNGIFTVLTLINFRARVIPFVIAIQLLVFKGINNENDKNNEIFSPTAYYIKKQKLIKKYTNWYDERYVSLSYLLLVHSFWILNILSQASLTTLMWGFSSYDKNGDIVFSMITSKRRSVTLIYLSLSIAISSSIIAGSFIGYKLYKFKNQ